MRIRADATPVIGAAVTIALGATVFVAWALGLDGVKSLLPDLPQMKANTALALIALGAAVLLLRDGATERAKRGGRALAGVVALFGLVVLGEYLFGSVGIDELLFEDTGTNPGRPAPHTAAAFALLGLALALLDTGAPEYRLPKYLMPMAAAVVVSALVGYLYDVDFLRATSGTTGMAVHTALALGAVTVGALWLRPRRGVVGCLSGAGLGSDVARRLLPAVLLLPLAIGVVLLQVGGDSEVRAALETLATMGILFVVVISVASRLTEVGEARAQAEAAIEQAAMRFAALLQATPDPLLVVNSEGVVMDANLELGRALGYERDELIGQPVELLVPERLRKRHVGHRAAYAAEPEVRPMGTGLDLNARRKDGAEFPVEISLSPLRTSEGMLVLAALRDVTERRRMEARLRQAAAYFETAHDLMCTVSFDGTFKELSGSWEGVLGWSEEELRARPILALAHRDDVAVTERELGRLAEGATVVQFVNRCRTRDGRWRWLEWSATPVVEDDLVYASARDVTERIEAQDARRDAEERFTRAFEEAPIGMALTDLDGRYMRVNRALCEVTGYSAEQLEATSYESITAPEDRAAEAAARADLLSGRIDRYRNEKRYVGANGETVPVDVSVTLIRDASGAASHFVSQVLDISERKRFEGQLQHLADHDSLTGLFNRRRFASELQRELASAARYDHGGALLALDLDHFKHVNDTLGHAVGDELITRVGSCLKHRVRATDILGRLGGDEFAILLPRASEDDARTVAEQVVTAIRDEGEVEGGRRVTASVGIAMFADPTTTSAEELMVEADIAMYDAKEAGRNRFAFFDSEGTRQARMQARLTWADRIRDALEANRFVLHAQPILNLDGDQTPRYELLVRMLGDNGDVIPPGAFLYIAERFELILALDRWVIREAVRLLAEQQRAGHDVRFEVNLSGKSVTSPDLPDFVAAELAAQGVDASRLCFEITETVAIVNVDRAKLFAHRLRTLGCEFALDDFGAGFASFYYLEHLDFDYIKIDGEFIRDLAHDRTNQLVVESLVRIARDMTKRTIAEFVGDKATLDLLREFGVDYAQGFYVGRPAAITSAGADAPGLLPALEAD